MHEGAVNHLRPLYRAETPFQEAKKRDFCTYAGMPECRVLSNRRGMT